MCDVNPVSDALDHDPTPAEVEARAIEGAERLHVVVQEIANREGWGPHETAVTLRELFAMTIVALIDRFGVDEGRTVEDLHAYVLHGLEKSLQKWQVAGRSKPVH